MYIRVTYLVERIDDHSGRVVPKIGRVITGKVLQRQDGYVTVQKDGGGTVMINEVNSVMASTMRIEYFATLADLVASNLPV